MAKETAAEKKARLEAAHLEAQKAELQEALQASEAITTDKIADEGITADKLGGESYVHTKEEIEAALNPAKAPEEESMTAPAPAEAHDTSSDPKPLAGVTEGRVVRYVIRDGVKAGEVRAGIISRVINAETGLVDITVFYQGPFDGRRMDNSTEYTPMVNHDADKSNGTWHFPERV